MRQDRFAFDIHMAIIPDFDMVLVDDNKAYISCTQISEFDKHKPI